MRQRFNKKKVRRFRRETGLDVIAAMIRGGTDHRVDLCLRDGTIWCRYKDGELMKWCGITHSAESVFSEGDDEYSDPQG